MLLGEKPILEDYCLAQVKFAYNTMPNQTTGKAPSIIVYGKLLLHVMDLTITILSTSGVESFIENEEAIRNMVQENISENNLRYKNVVDENGRDKQLKVIEFMMVHLTKGRLPTGTHNKLKKHNFGLC